MREILFRGKRLDNGEWVEGDICHHDGVVSYIGQHPADGSMVCYDLDPETVGQFTGMWGKNGKRIFEGDIVEIENEGSYQCVWAQGNLEFALTNKKESFGLAYVPLCDVTVIGNIHDNPELLEVTPDERMDQCEG